MFVCLLNIVWQVLDTGSTCIYIIRSMYKSFRMYWILISFISADNTNSNAWQVLYVEICIVNIEEWLDVLQVLLLFTLYINSAWTDEWYQSVIISVLLKNKCNFSINHVECYVAGWWVGDFQNVHDTAALHGQVWNFHWFLFRYLINDFTGIYTPRLELLYLMF